MESTLPSARRVLRLNDAACFQLHNVLMDGNRLGSVWPMNFREGERWAGQDTTTGQRSFHDTREDAAVEVCLRSGWGPWAPAQPDDFRFEIFPWDEPEMDATHTVVMIDDRGEEIDRFDTTDPYGIVEAARERQAMPDLEDRLNYYAAHGIGN